MLGVPGLLSSRSGASDLKSVTVVRDGDGTADAQSAGGDSDDEEMREARERRARVVSRWRRAYAQVLELARLGFGSDFGSGAYIEIDLRGGKTLPPQVERKLRREYRGRVEVQVVDYCLTAARPRLVRWSNYSDGATGMRALREFLDMPRPVLSLLEPQIRWVKAEGFAWDLVKTLAGRYNLPPLLVSDLLGVENTEVLENFRSSGGGGGSSDPGPAPGGAGGWDETWISGTSMPHGRAAARSGSLRRRSGGGPPGQGLSRSSQPGSGSWEKPNGAYSGGSASGAGGGSGGGGGGSGGPSSGGWWPWGRGAERADEPLPEDPHRRTKTEYYGSDGILYISMPMIGLRTRLLLRSAAEQQQAAAAAAAVEREPAPAAGAAAGGAIDAATSTGGAGLGAHGGAHGKAEAGGRKAAPASNPISLALEATIAAAMRPGGGGFGSMPVAEGTEAPAPASDPAAAAAVAAPSAPAGAVSAASGGSTLARPLDPAPTAGVVHNPLVSVAVGQAVAQVGPFQGAGGQGAAGPSAAATTVHVTATAAATRGVPAGLADAGVGSASVGAGSAAARVDMGTGSAVIRHHGGGGAGVGAAVGGGGGGVGAAVGGSGGGVDAAVGGGRVSAEHQHHHHDHGHHHGHAHGGQRRSGDLGWGSVASGGSVADVGVETESPHSLEAWMRWLRGACRCGRPPSRGRKPVRWWQQLFGGGSSRGDEYLYEKRWVEEPIVLLLVQDKTVHGPGNGHAPPNPGGGVAASAGGGGGGSGGAHGVGAGARGVTLISIFHYSGRSVTYRVWRQITSGATGSMAVAAAAFSAAAAAATAASFSQPRIAGLGAHPAGAATAAAGGRGGVAPGLTPQEQLLHRISTSAAAGSSHSLISEVRRSDAGYLLYLIMRGAVDQAYDVVRDFSAQLSDFERRVRSGNLSATATEQLHVMSTDLQLLDRRFKATTTVLRLLTTKDVNADSGTVTDSPAQLSANAQAKIKALVEQVRGINDEIDSLGTQASQLTDLVFNLIAHRSNNSMRVLSIISTVFLPVTFLAGVYGTNFEWVPELHWYLGYMYFWLLITGVGVVVFAIANKYVH
ncbi:hypothetical protein HXX76_002300 [Chlamydomonas incerta]|uniref:Magnesium transporter n=1 Tax=Chlamydomonas incerta TaxID=51695 RepID=A0A836B0D7_CHLIN|nr:hypothetical protein HXX76_002300 [Chlamydomonas incerta]|eukprot:KAG2443961.1 hypothetical protein HXX76_002300 [Chlamydomonas incerta]